MARYKEKSEAIRLRKKGYSYSQIKEKLGISKSTLSGWLQPYPLSEKRIRELRDNSPQRIERYINTMRKKREEGFSIAYEQAKKDIGTLSERELFIAGFFLYWAEGGKTRRSTLAFTNTDPGMLKMYMRWLNILKVPKEKLKIKLHVYKDMNVDKEISFWCKELGVDKTKFHKTWVKKSKMTDLTYKNNFGHGTCNIILNDTSLTVYVLMGIKFIANVMSESGGNMRA
jgi:lambda repressor-like predicted transcriptional regulator